MGKRKLAVVGICLVIAGGIAYWMQIPELKEELPVCAVYPAEGEHPEIVRPPCTKEEAAKRRAYYGGPNVFPLGVYTTPTNYN